MGISFRRELEFLYKSQYWSTGKWETFQENKIKRLLKYCFEHVPFYNRKFNQIGLDINSDNIFNEFNRIPFIDKEIVLKHFDEFISDEYSKRNLYEVSTGGTTGKPLKYYWTKKCFLKEWAYKIFFWGLAIDYQPNSKKATFRGVKFGDKLFYENPLYNEIRFSPFKLNNTYISTIIEKLNNYNPDFLHGYTSAIELLAKYYLKIGCNTPKLKGIILISENIYPGQKEYISKVFNAPVYSFYGHTERVIFASMMEKLNYYYLHPAYGYTELIDSNKLIINQPSIRGELVGTGFINEAMPLIRYRTGDFAEYIGENLSDNKRNFKGIKNIIGRWNQEQLIGKNGTKISIAALNMHSDVYKNIKNFQFYQETKGQVILNIVKTKDYSSNDEEKIKSELSEKLGSDYHIVFQYKNELPRTQSGKLKYIVQRLNVDKV
jgi:phenylacetate-CoA ligase